MVAMRDRQTQTAWVTRYAEATTRTHNVINQLIDYRASAAKASVLINNDMKQLGTQPWPSAGLWPSVKTVQSSTVGPVIIRAPATIWACAKIFCASRGPFEYLQAAKVVPKTLSTHKTALEYLAAAHSCRLCESLPVWRSLRIFRVLE